METEKELNAKILEVTMEIQEHHPELINYVQEMQATIPDTESPEINIRNLKDYYESLTALLKNYLQEHE